MLPGIFAQKSCCHKKDWKNQLEHLLFSTHYWLSISSLCRVHHNEVVETSLIPKRFLFRFWSRCRLFWRFSCWNWFRLFSITFGRAALLYNFFLRFALHLTFFTWFKIGQIFWISFWLITSTTNITTWYDSSSYCWIFASVVKGTESVKSWIAKKKSRGNVLSRLRNTLRLKLHHHLDPIYFSQHPTLANKKSKHLFTVILIFKCTKSSNWFRCVHKIYIRTQKQLVRRATLSFTLNIFTKTCHTCKQKMQA